MTAREYAKAVGFGIIGKLTKKVITHKKYDVKKDDFVEEKITFWIDEGGNEFHKDKNGWAIITVDGGCI